MIEKEENTWSNWINWRIKLIAALLTRGSESYLISSYEEEWAPIPPPHSASTRHIAFDIRSGSTSLRTFYRGPGAVNRGAYGPQPRWFRKLPVGLMRIDMPLGRLLLTPQVSRNKRMRVYYLKRIALSLFLIWYITFSLRFDWRLLRT